MLILDTPRLLLRWFEPSDAEAVLRLVTDPEWIRHIGDRGMTTAAEARAYIEGPLRGGCWRWGLGCWAATRRDDGALVGLAGLVRRESLPHVDVAYALLPEHRGAGYAREAAAACLRYGFDALRLPRILAITTLDNGPSRRVLEALGMAHEGEQILPGEDKALAVYGLDSPSPAPDEGDDAEIYALIQRFFGLFDTRARPIPLLPTLPAWCLPSATFVNTSGPSPVAQDLRAFMEARAALFSTGRLTGFSEEEVGGETRIRGAIAQRWSRYTKAGVLDGAPFTGRGQKAFDLVKTPDGWRLAALSWWDEPQRA